MTETIDHLRFSKHLVLNKCLSLITVVPVVFKSVVGKTENINFHSIFILGDVKKNLTVADEHITSFCTSGDVLFVGTYTFQNSSFLIWTKFIEFIIVNFRSFWSISSCFVLEKSSQNIGAGL